MKTYVTVKEDSIKKEKKKKKEKSSVVTKKDYGLTENAKIVME